MCYVRCGSEETTKKLGFWRVTEGVMSTSEKLDFWRIAEEGLGNVQEARILATCLTKGGSQRGLRLFETIRFHAHHGGSHSASRAQKKLKVCSCAT